MITPVRLNSSASGCSIRCSADQRVVDQALGLQQHDPRRDAHQDRGPERHQHQDHQHVGLARRQRAEPVGERVAQQQAPQRDDRADLEGAHQDAAEHALVGIDALDRALRVAPQVDRGEQVVGRPARAVLRDRLPVLRFGPALVEREQPALTSAGVAAPSSGSALKVFITSERAPGTSLLSRRARAPASELSGKAPRSCVSAAKASASGTPSRFQPCSASTVRGSAFATSGFSTARLSSARSARGRSAAGTAAAAA